jgi:hypothetical protein
MGEIFPLAQLGPHIQLYVCEMGELRMGRNNSPGQWWNSFGKLEKDNYHISYYFMPFHRYLYVGLTYIFFSFPNTHMHSII